MTEQPLNVRRAIAVTRRRWVSIFALALAGSAVGLLLTVLRPPSYVARSGVLLPPSAVDAQGKPLRNVETEVSIASSAEVLGRAGKSLKPPRSPAALKDRVDVRALSVDILEMRAQATSPREAARVANAVATEYVSYSETASFQRTDRSMTLFRDQATDLDERIRDLDSQIAAVAARMAGQKPGSPEGAQQQALLDSLRSSQVNTSRQLSVINSRIADAQLEAELTRSGLRVLEPATAPSHPVRPRLVLNTGIGGMVGLALGVLFAVAHGQRDRRVRARDEFAETAAAPVLLSLAVQTPKRLKDYRERLAQWVPSATERLALRQAFEQLGISPDNGANLVVGTLPGDRAALGLVMELASFAATSGMATSLLVTTTDPSMRDLRSACHSLTSGVDPRPSLSVSGTPPEAELDELGEFALTISLVNAADDDLAVPTWGRETYTTLAVSSGFATAETVASVALAWFDADHPLDGVLLANPEPTDTTTGRVVVHPLSSEHARIKESRHGRDPASVRSPAPTSERVRQIK